MITALISRLIILAFGTLYPAYASYKAVRTKDVKEYVKWMMYWIVFALFTCAETFTDVLLSFWFPFYYELKIAIVFWLLSPATKGSSFLYRNFVHPAFQKRESEIDEYFSHAKEKGYATVMNFGSRGVSYATNVIVQTALKGGGGIFEQLRKSYSLGDLGPKLTDVQRPGPKSGQPPGDMDTTDLISEPRLLGADPRAVRGRRGISGGQGMDMYFSEVDVNLHPYHAGEPLGEIRSTEDISSGYSSTDQLFGEGGLVRTTSVNYGRGRGKRGGRVMPISRPPLAEDVETLEKGDPVSDKSNPSSPPLPSPPVFPFNPDDIPENSSSLQVESTSSEFLHPPFSSYDTPTDPNKNEGLLLVMDQEITRTLSLENVSNYESLFEDSPDESVSVNGSMTLKFRRDSNDSEPREDQTEIFELAKSTLNSCNDLSAVQSSLNSAIVEMRIKVEREFENLNRTKRAQGKLSSSGPTPRVFLTDDQGGTCEEIEDSCISRSSEAGSQLSLVSDRSEASDSERKGRYRKLPAPSPPAFKPRETAI